MYDILVYLFENCQQAEIAYDSDRVARKLSAAGFEEADISEALHWLAGMDEANWISRRMPHSRSSFRAFSAREAAKMDAECQGFLITLEQSGVLDAYTRELVLERALAAAGSRLSLEQLKLIVLMVLWNRQLPTTQLLAEDLFSARDGRLPS